MGETDRQPSQNIGAPCTKMRSLLHYSSSKGTSIGVCTCVPCMYVYVVCISTLCEYVRCVYVYVACCVCRYVYVFVMFMYVYVYVVCMCMLCVCVPCVYVYVV